MTEQELERAVETRVRELLADNDAMRGEIWALSVALRVMAERLVELESAASGNQLRDEDEDTARPRFGAPPRDRKPLGQQIRDREDRYWCGPQAPCTVCGAVDDLPRGVEYDEYVCEACKDAGVPSVS